ncbi:MAG: lipoprotein [Gammaproteobacteria bacterium]|nr:lipoprotein [Gammaproteobacteria bacterium]MBU2546636.1 lipoprotein [Gammaproteobacteria bacterium]
MKRFLRYSALVMIFFLLSGCGQSGSLYLPKTAHTQTSAQPA